MIRVHNAHNDAELRKAIKAQMQPASVVLIMAGVYATYSKWIDEEIKLAQSGFTCEKPILAITPWGAERIYSVVREAAKRNGAVVKWNTQSIVDAIRRHARSDVYT